MPPFAYGSRNTYRILRFAEFLTTCSLVPSRRMTDHLLDARISLLNPSIDMGIQSTSS
jgi:hypothetical protein